jgi:hypothetical protein
LVITARKPFSLDFTSCELQKHRQPSPKAPLDFRAVR